MLESKPTPLEKAKEELGFADVAELRNVDDIRVCSKCLVVNSADDTFCTACGADLPVGQAKEGVVASTSDPPVLSPLIHPVSSEPQSEVRRRPQLIVLGVVVAALALVAGVIVFAVLWRAEAREANRLSSDLSATRSELSSKQAELKETEGALEEARSLSEKRRSVLVRARAVLASVDPILSSVDEIQTHTADIQSERDTLMGDTESLMTNLVTLANYAIQTDPLYMDQGYLNQLIDAANADLYRVRADGDTLGSSDAAYGAASERFSNRASAFTNAIRRLQRQLRQVAPK